MHILKHLLVVLFGTAAAQAASPFSIEATAQQQDGQPLVRVALQIPAQHFIYHEHLKISADSAQLTPVNHSKVVMSPCVSSRRRKLFPLCGRG
ncbi:MAG: hypothetical protein NTY53_19055 [Kiritimatiellaeota bacterium]|nr:hypothetical protein [Kiritimatiellota bacterium]